MVVRRYESLGTRAPVALSLDATTHGVVRTDLLDPPPLTTSRHSGSTLVEPGSYCGRYQIVVCAGPATERRRASRPNRLSDEEGSAEEASQGCGQTRRPLGGGDGP